MHPRNMVEQNDKQFLFYFNILVFIGARPEVASAIFLQNKAKVKKFFTLYQNLIGIFILFETKLKIKKIRSLSYFRIR